MYEFTVVGHALMIVSPYCLCTTVTSKSLANLLETSDEGGSYSDEHPWFAARALHLRELEAARSLPLILAVEDSGAEAQLSHWTVVTEVDVVTLHRGSWATRVRFAALRAVNPIWAALDSVLLKAGDDQLAREAMEPIRRHRQALDARHVHPYAICETPAFIVGDAAP